MLPIKASGDLSVKRVIMSITELAIHNVLRTYSRQDRLGRIQRPRSGAASPSDKLDLSDKAQKFAAVGRTADEIVSRRFPAIEGEARETRLREQVANLVKNHAGEIEDKAVAPDALEEKLRSIYLPK